MTPALRAAVAVTVAAPLSLPFAMASAADDLLCRFDSGMEIRFAIDRTQFVPPVDQNEPPRRKVTQVRLGPQSFVAEPILMAGGVRGFWTDDPVTGSHLLTTRTDGTADYSGPKGSTRGFCEDMG